MPSELKCDVETSFVVDRSDSLNGSKYLHTELQETSSNIIVATVMQGVTWSLNQARDLTSTKSQRQASPKKTEVRTLGSQPVLLISQYI